MTTATELPAPSAPPARPETVADLLHRLGDIPPDRVRMHPFPGTATFEDLVRVNEERRGPVCEWVENTLVEKHMGQRESWVNFIIMGELYMFASTRDLGMFLGPDGVMKILPGLGRAPDVSFLSWKSLPGGKPPPRSDKVPAVVPDLVVEVLSASDTPREMARKRDEYFRAGVKLVWEIDPESRSANVFTGPNQVAPVPADGTLDGGDLLPGFTLSLAEVFARAERR
ncbi:MAG: Uma2 family endonuclease [Isosphaera sp.]|nr:Uma2 family endonuclease [Isosphaera sp.]